MYGRRCVNGWEKSGVDVLVDCDGLEMGVVSGEFIFVVSGEGEVSLV